MFAFGISTQGLQYHNMPISLELVKSVFLPAYFIIGKINYYKRKNIIKCFSFFVEITSIIKNQKRKKTNIFNIFGT